MGPAWTPLGPAGPYTHSLVVAPSDPNTAYARSGITQTLMSTADGGQHWELLPGSESLGTVYVDPTSARVLYESGPGTPEHSEDGGATWSPFVGLASIRGAANLIGVDADHELYVISNWRLLRGTTNQARWRTMGPLPPLHGLEFRGAVVEPGASGTIFLRLGIYGGAQELYRSTDGGASWQQVLSSTTDISSMAFDASNGDMYVGGWDSALARESTDGGASWAPLPTSPAGAGGVAALAAAGGSLYAVFGLVQYGAPAWVTRDAGASWQPADGGATQSLSELAAAGADGLYGAGVYGVFRSDPAGTSWRTAHGNLTAPGFSGSGAVVGDGDRLWVSGGDGRLWHSADGGGTWSVSLVPGAIAALAGVPSVPDELYAAVRLTDRWAVGRSTDAGKTWAFGGTIPTVDDSVDALAVDPLDPAVLLVGTGPGEIFRSTDAGATWTLAATATGMYGHTAISVLAFDATAPSLALAGGDGVGELVSDDGGLTWTQAAGDPSHILALADGTLLRYGSSFCCGMVMQRSADRGSTWQSVASGFEAATTVGSAVVAARPTVALSAQPGSAPDGLYEETASDGAWRPIAGSWLSDVADPLASGASGAVLAAQDGLWELRSPLNSSVTGDLHVSVEAPTSAGFGDTVSATITVENRGAQTAHDVLVLLPRWYFTTIGLSQGDCDVAGVYADQTVACPLGDLAPGASAEIEGIDVAAYEPIHVVATATADQLEATGADNSASADITVLGGAPTAITGTADVTPDGNVTLHGHVATGGLPTEWAFQYGGTLVYGSVTDTQTVNADGDVQATIRPTSRGPYHYRLVAVNDYGAAAGVDATFALPAPSIVVTGVERSSTDATLSVSITAHGQFGTLEADYGPTAAYGSTTPRQPLNGSDPIARSLIIPAAVDSTVHYRLTVSTIGGLVTTSDATIGPFTPPPPVTEPSSADTTAPTVLLARPRCPASLAHARCAAWLRTSAAWRQLVLAVRDAAPSSGISLVEVQVTQHAGSHCRVVYSGRLHTLSCKAAASHWVALHHSGSVWKTSLPALGKGTWTVHARALDRDGNTSRLVTTVLHLTR
jgi:hypothetical protein